MIDIPKGVKGLIFDCDGTIVDNMPLHFISWQNAFNDFGCEFSAEFMAKMSGCPNLQTVEVYNDEFGTGLVPEDVVESKENHYSELMHQAEPVDAVCDTIREYFGKLPISVVSGSARASVDKSLKVASVDALFEIVLTADDPFKPKPAPDLFLEAAKRMGVESQDCVVFEDGEAGMIGASEAGMKVIDVCYIVEDQRQSK